MDKFFKIVIFLLTGLLLIANVSVAEKRYVTDNLGITLRTGPGGDRKIIAQPKSGTPLQIIKAGKDYTEVITPSGKRGWVLTRYLTSKVPAFMTLSRLKKEYARVVKEYDALKQKISQLNTTSKGVSSQLATTQKALDKLTNEYDNLKKESQEFLNLKTKYQKSVKEASQMRTKADKLDKELQQLYSSEMNTGLLYGGILIIIGFVVGFIVKRPRRKSPLL